MTRDDDDDDWVKKHVQRGGRQTSRKAARTAEKSTLPHKWQVLQCLQEKGDQTSEEIAANTGLKDKQVWKRISDLKNAGLVEDTGDTRQNESGSDATVWRAVEGAEPTPPKQKGLFDE